MSWDDTENYRMGGTFQWPRVEEARQYRSKVSLFQFDLTQHMTTI